MASLTGLMEIQMEFIKVLIVDLDPMIAKTKSKKFSDC